MTLTVDDDLEVRNVDGEYQFVTSIVEIDGDIIVTHYGCFRISGKKNVAGVEIFEHIPNPDDYSVLHAVRANNSGEE
jgi:hypothetical protein